MPTLHTQTFLGLDAPQCSWEEARVAVLPVPYEKTVSYGGGAAAGPEAILAASAQVELYDEEGERDPSRVGIATLAPLDVAECAPQEMADRVQRAVADILAAGKRPLVLGGEHSITPPAVAAVHAAHPDCSVVQLDAHADLRESYEGEPMSHASALARVRERCPAVQVGIRSCSEEEGKRIRRDKLPIFFAREIHRDPDWINEAIDAIESEAVYCTIDVDVFDGSLLPATGTPEPGGLDWPTVTAFLQALFTRKEVLGFDLVELAPIPRMHAYDFLVAKLAYRCIGYWQETLLRR